MKIDITHTITPRQIADLIITAFGGGISYWCKSATATVIPPGVDPAKFWYDQEAFWADGAEWAITFTGVEKTDGPWHLTPAKLEEGLKKIASGSRHDMKLISGLIYDEYDASDADYIIQMCLLGEIVYG